MINIKKYSELFGFLSGITSLALGILSFITRILDNQYALLLLLVGFFFVIRKIFKVIITEKKEVLGVTTQKYSSRAIRWAKFGKVASYSIWIYPFFLLYLFFSSFTTKCISDNKVGVLVTRFSNNSDDDFSYKLFHILEDKFQDIDSINTVKNDLFINLSNNKYIDTLKRVINGNCINKGLLVFGKRSELSKLFDCNIYLHNLSKVSSDSFNARKSDVLFLQNPDVLNFSIDEQAIKVADFIQGLLYLNVENQELARTCFQRAADITGTKNNRFMSHCMFFIGNCLAKQHNFSESIRHYEKGLQLDSINAYMHFNLGAVLLMNGDSASAFIEYSLANRINPQFINPIKDYLPAKPLTSKPRTVSILPIVMKKNGSVRQDQVGKNEKDTVTFKKVSCGEKIGVNDSHGRIILECKFDFVGPPLNYKNYNYFIVGVSNKYGAYNLKGQKIIPIIHPSDDYVRGVLKAAIDLAPESLTPIKE